LLALLAWRSPGLWSDPGQVWLSASAGDAPLVAERLMVFLLGHPDIPTEIRHG